MAKAKSKSKQQRRVTSDIVALATISETIAAKKAQLDQEVEDARVTLGFKKTALAQNKATTKKNINEMFGPVSKQSSGTKKFVESLDGKILEI